MANERSLRKVKLSEEEASQHSSILVQFFAQFFVSVGPATLTP